MDSAALDNVTQEIIDELVGDTRVVLTSAALLVTAVISIAHVASYWVRKCRGTADDDTDDDTTRQPLTV